MVDKGVLTDWFYSSIR